MHDIAFGDIEYHAPARNPFRESRSHWRTSVSSINEIVLYEGQSSVGRQTDEWMICGRSLGEEYKG